MVYLCNKLVLFLIFLNVFSSGQASLNTIEAVLQSYEDQINSSHILDKSDRSFMKSWTADCQVKQVNLTAHYRLQMTRHKEHVFTGIKENSKWIECIDLHHQEIQKYRSQYFENEGICLKTANTAAHKAKKAVKQVEKEIRKWRKSYRYLSNQCNLNNPDDKEAAGVCLIEYMKTDNYDQALQRLTLLKLTAMSQLLQDMNASLTSLEDCLKGCLSNYLEHIRVVMNALNRCYSIRNNGLESSESN